LELTDDIRFDKSLKEQRENKAARTIQRWYKSKVHDRMMREADRAVEETRRLIQLKKERLLKNYASTIGGQQDNVRDSITYVEGILGAGKKVDTAIDYEKWHVDRGENFSLFAPAPVKP